MAIPEFMIFQRTEIGNSTKSCCCFWVLFTENMKKLFPKLTSVRVFGSGKQQKLRNIADYIAYSLYFLLFLLVRRLRLTTMSSRRKGRQGKAPLWFVISVCVFFVLIIAIILGLIPLYIASASGKYKYMYPILTQKFF